MQFINTAALAIAFLTTSGLAAPFYSPTSVTVQLANDQSGANADIAVPADGQAYSIQQLYGSTAVAEHGLVFASSAQVVAFQQATSCTITGQSSPSVTLDSQRTWESFGGVVDLCSATITCVCEGM
ncbi:hypothetical protein N7474_006925 [Penicillium riverlandense]|uniref:uncharacterized protein n=1 Tax=Penicillium riverlandense TaxID=1903569 RepID=UPI0025465915|nr:uncharacterized protein N7474_006925 [Penicillium riverlandense]KAJ5815148.1 hypothetical protein N7474_006925 [Penicillium riverlandense]